MKKNVKKTRNAVLIVVSLDFECNHSFPERLKTVVLDFDKDAERRILKQTSLIRSVYNIVSHPSPVFSSSVTRFLGV